MAVIRDRLGGLSLCAVRALIAMIWAAAAHAATAHERTTPVRHLGGVVARAHPSHLPVSTHARRDGRLTSTGVGGRNGRERHTVGLDNLNIERKVTCL